MPTEKVEVDAKMARMAQTLKVRVAHARAMLGDRDGYVCPAKTLGDALAMFGAMREECPARYVVRAKIAELARALADSCADFKKLQAVFGNVATASRDGASALAKKMIECVADSEDAAKFHEELFATLGEHELIAWLMLRRCELSALEAQQATTYDEANRVRACAVTGSVGERVAREKMLAFAQTREQLAHVLTSCSYGSDAEQNGAHRLWKMI